MKYFSTMIGLLLFLTNLQASKVTFKWGQGKSQLGYLNHNIKEYEDEETPMGPLSFDVAKDGRIVFSDTFNRRLQIYDSNGRHLKSISGLKPALAYPGDLKIAGDEIYFIDSLRQKIVGVTFKGKLIREFAGNSKNGGHLVQAHQLEITRDGKFLVGDRGTSKIEVFDKSGEHLRSVPWNLNGFSPAENDSLLIVGYTEKSGFNLQKISIMSEMKKVLFSLNKKSGTNPFIYGKRDSGYVISLDQITPPQNVDFFTYGKRKSRKTTRYCNDVRRARLTKTGSFYLLNYDAVNAPKGLVTLSIGK